MHNLRLMILITLGFFVSLFSGAAYAEDPLLIVRGENVQFPITREILEKMPVKEYKALLPGMDDKFHTVRGPLMRDILALAGVNGTKMEAMALDQYQIEIPVEDVTRYDVIVATSVDGAPLTVRTKGPIWLVYPSFDNPELRLNPIYEARSIWQLSEITVK